MCSNFVSRVKQRCLATVGMVLVKFTGRCLNAYIRREMSDEEFEKQRQLANEFAEEMQSGSFDSDIVEEIQNYNSELDNELDGNDE